MKQWCESAWLLVLIVCFLLSGLCVTAQAEPHGEQAEIKGIVGTWICNYATQQTIGRKIETIPCVGGMKIQNVDAEGTLLSIELIPATELAGSLSVVPEKFKVVSLNERGCADTSTREYQEEVCYNKEKDIVVSYFRSGNTNITTISIRQK